jgi:hypothetical protein
MRYTLLIAVMRTNPRQSARAQRARQNMIDIDRPFLTLDPFDQNIRAVI